MSHRVYFQDCVATYMMQKHVHSISYKQTLSCTIQFGPIRYVVYYLSLSMTTYIISLALIRSLLRVQ